MRRIMMLVAVVAMMAAMMVASALPAFAAPTGPGPNSFEPFDQGGPTERLNFGQCQEDTAKEPGISGSSAKQLNPSFGNFEQDPAMLPVCLQISGL